MSSKTTWISELSSSEPGWVIRARVISKSPVKQWNNAKSKGCFFHVTLKDSSYTTIRATFFKKAVDQFHGILEVGNLYFFSKGLVKMANPKFNSCQSNTELIMDTNSDITLLKEKDTEKESKPESLAVTPPPKPLAPPMLSRAFYHSTDIKSGAIKQGDWKKRPSHPLKKPNRRVSTSFQRPSEKEVSGAPVTPPSQQVTGPLRDANLSDEKRAQLRVDRAAAAEARFKKQQCCGLKKKRKTSAAPLVSPHSSKRMRWSL
jgi:hypothetical protein